MSDITEIGHFVGGRTVAGTSGNTSPVYNPATGQQTGAVALASVEELDAAVAVANAAFQEWRSSSVAKRTEAMFNLRNLVKQNASELATKLTALMSGWRRMASTAVLSPLTPSFAIPTSRR